MTSRDPRVPAPILTLTGNLLAERTLEFTAWSPGRTQRALRESFQVGGKGINVSRMLTRLQAPNVALCFAGAAPGDECLSWLRERGLAHQVFRTRAASRVGIVVRTAGDGSPVQPETTFLGPDVAPDAESVRACADFLDAQPAGAVLAVCGSLPGWSTPAFEPLRAACRRWRSRGSLAVDTYGPALAWFAALPADLIKINAAELRSLGGGDTAPPGPAPRWIITDGPKAVQLRDSSGTRTVLPPPVREVSPTGSGDVLFACVLDAIFRRGCTLDEAVAFALPRAAANAAHPGIAEFPEPLDG